MQITSKQAALDEAKLEKALESLPNKLLFSEFEDKMILKYYHVKGCVAVAHVLNKNPKQISARFHTLKDRANVKSN